MARKTLIESYKDIYHIIRRGNNRSFIYQNNADKDQLISILEAAIKQFDFQLLAYVIMDNHYHLMIKRFTASLSDIMHFINHSYSRYYNKKYRRSGTIYDNKLKKILVEDDPYLLTLLRYIHYNPVRARITSSINTYYYSSDLSYRQNNSQFISIDVLLNIIHQDRPKALHYYKLFMDRYSTDHLLPFTITTDRALLDYMYLGQPKRQPPHLADLLYTATQDHDICKQILSGSRKRSLTPYKVRFIRIARGWDYTYDAIASYIGVSKTAILKTEKGVHSCQ